MADATGHGTATTPAKRYDAATKHVLDLRPADWLPFLGLPEGPVTLLDSDLSTVTSAADRLMRVDAPIPYGVHGEFFSGKDGATVAGRLLPYNVIAEVKYGLPILSFAFLLHRRADSPKLTGELTKIGPDGRPYLVFRYQAVRLWEVDPQLLLTGGLGLVPFAPLGKTTPAELPEIIRRGAARIEAEAESEKEAEDLRTATIILTGLRYNKAWIKRLMQEVGRMRESAGYQLILEEGRQEGRAEGEYKALLVVGEKRLGEPSPRVLAALQAITSVKKLEALLRRVTDVESWDELLR